MKKHWRGAFAGLAISVLLVGCGGQSADQNTGEAGETEPESELDLKASCDAMQSARDEAFASIDGKPMGQVQDELPGAYREYLALIQPLVGQAAPDAQATVSSMVDALTGVVNTNLSPSSLGVLVSASGTATVACQAAGSNFRQG